jgi:hypothetical protein
MAPSSLADAQRETSELFTAELARTQTTLEEDLAESLAERNEEMSRLGDIDTIRRHYYCRSQLIQSTYLSDRDAVNKWHAERQAKFQQVEAGTLSWQQLQAWLHTHALGSGSVSAGRANELPTTSDLHTTRSRSDEEMEDRFLSSDLK